MSIVTAALLQWPWTGGRESMLAAHEEQARLAAARGAQVLCFQELFAGPYFCQGEDPAFRALAEPVPGPTTERFQALAAELGLVLVLPLYEVDRHGDRYNSAAVLDADGAYLGTYRKTHIPDVPGFRERYYFRPGDLGFPVFDTAAGRLGVCLCYDKHFPEVWRALAINGAQIVVNPAAVAGPRSQAVWRLEAPAAAFANQYFVAAVNRVGLEPGRTVPFYGSSYVVDPDGQVVGAPAAADRPELIVRDLDLGLIDAARARLDLLGGRRPAVYGDLTRP